MSNEKSSKQDKGRELRENIVNIILNNEILSFLIIFGLFGGIIFLLVKLNPGNLILNFPQISFWIFFLLILLGATIFYFVTLYKNNKGKLQLRYKSAKMAQASPRARWPLAASRASSKYIEWCPEGFTCRENKMCEDIEGKGVVKGKCNTYVNFADGQSREIFGEFMQYPLKILKSIIFLFGAVTLTLFILSKFSITVKLLEIAIITIIIIIGLGISYLLLFSGSEEIKSKDDFGEFVREFIFFIPCLLIELVKYLKNQFNITTEITWILLFLEVILIIFYFLIPTLLKQSSTKGGTMLLEGPIYTNNLRDLGSIEKKNLNYSVALQLWINPQPENTASSYSKWSSLFNYGNRPNILYNGKKRMIKVVSMNGKNDLVTVYKSQDFPFQSWMKIVIIYRGSIIDVFVNDKLVGSLSNVNPYIETGKITSGVEDGINGGIKDIIYFNRPLDKNEIIWVE